MELLRSCEENGVEFPADHANVAAMFNCRCLILLLLVGVISSTEAASAKIKKVLPHYLDKEGRHSLAPSLYERDAYQAMLRRNPSERSALRFDVNWNAGGLNGAEVLLRLELRSSKNGQAKPVVIETRAKVPTAFSRWTSVSLSGDAYKNLGDLIAWRATLWDGETLLAEQRSFLW